MFQFEGGSQSDRIRPTGNDVTRLEGDLEPSRFLVNNSTVWMTFYADRGTTFNGFSIQFLPVYSDGKINALTLEVIS